MESNDLAIIIPHLGQEALYRVLSSLTLQSDKRFTVYGFFQHGETEVKALFEDYADHLDLVLCGVDAYPAGDAAISELAAFFLKPLGGEHLVTFSDGGTIYDRHCVRQLHATALASPDCDLFRWNKCSGTMSFRTFVRGHLLGEKDIPLSELVVRRQAFERFVAASDYFSLRQVLADLAAAGGILSVKAPVGHPDTPVYETQEQVNIARERCSVVEWAEVHFAGSWPVGRWISLMRSADLFTNLIPWVSKEEARERYLALRLAQDSPGLARLAFMLNSWGL